MKPPSPPPDTLEDVTLIVCAIEKARLYGIAELLGAEGYGACARDVRMAADYIEAMRTKAH